MKEVKVTCPQCGQDDVYFEYEKGDFTADYIWIIKQPWQCRVCGYPYISWNRWNHIHISKPVVHIKITDEYGNIVKEWYENE